MEEKEKQVIGRYETVVFDAQKSIGLIPAKVDTGAFSSSIWATDIEFDDDGDLSFVFFGPSSPYYTGERVHIGTYEVKKVRSSSGHMQNRYVVLLSVRIAGRKIRGRFTLADRSSNTYPVLIGNRLIRYKFLVDVAKSKPILMTGSMKRKKQNS